MESLGIWCGDLVWGSEGGTGGGGAWRGESRRLNNLTTPDRIDPRTNNTPTPYSIHPTHTQTHLAAAAADTDAAAAAARPSKAAGPGRRRPGSTQPPPAQARGRGGPRHAPFLSLSPVAVCCDCLGALVCGGVSTEAGGAVSAKACRVQVRGMTSVDVVWFGWSARSNTFDPPSQPFDRLLNESKFYY